MRASASTTDQKASCSHGTSPAADRELDARSRPSSRSPSASASAADACGVTPKAACACEGLKRSCTARPAPRPCASCSVITGSPQATSLASPRSTALRPAPMVMSRAASLSPSLSEPGRRCLEVSCSGKKVLPMAAVPPKASSAFSQKDAPPTARLSRVGAKPAGLVPRSTRRSAPFGVSAARAVSAASSGGCATGSSSSRLVAARSLSSVGGRR
mmetsp:Transcript_26601/g.67508  ORF Transcript_26601/g.67508 Transcript_26601/m.67508 type:complete len:215 (+) Transcript_26601:3055-3699(+)